MQRPELADPALPFGLARRIGGVHVFDAEERETLLRDPGWVRPGVRQLCLEPFYREVVSDPVNEILHAYMRGRMAEDALLQVRLAPAPAPAAAPTVQDLMPEDSGNLADDIAEAVRRAMASLESQSA